jgi:hypothetical protein
MVTGTALVPVVVAELGRGSSHTMHLDLEASLLSIQVPHTQEPVTFAGAFSPAASQLKPTEAGFAPGVNVNAGREEGPATEAALRSLACLKGDCRPVDMSKENDGKNEGSRRRAACFGSLETGFVVCDSVLGLASGSGVMTAVLGAEGVGRLGITGVFCAVNVEEGAGD